MLGIVAAYYDVPFYPTPWVQPPTNEGSYYGSNLHLEQSAIFRQHICHGVR